MKVDDIPVIGAEPEEVESPSPPFRSIWLVIAVAAVGAVAAIWVASSMNTVSEQVPSAIVLDLAPPTTAATPTTLQPRFTPVETAVRFEWESVTGLEEATSLFELVQFDGRTLLLGATDRGATLWEGNDDGTDWSMVAEFDGTAGTFMGSAATAGGSLIVAIALVGDDKPETWILSSETLVDWSESRFADSRLELLDGADQVVLYGLMGLDDDYGEMVRALPDPIRELTESGVAWVSFFEGFRSDLTEETVVSIGVLRDLIVYEATFEELGVSEPGGVEAARTTLLIGPSIDHLRTQPLPDDSQSIVAMNDGTLISNGADLAVLEEQEWRTISYRIGALGATAWQDGVAYIGPGGDTIRFTVPGPRPYDTLTPDSVSLDFLQLLGIRTAGPSLASYGFVGTFTEAPLLLRSDDAEATVRGGHLQVTREGTVIYSGTTASADVTWSEGFEALELRDEAGDVVWTISRTDLIAGLEAQSAGRYAGGSRLLYSPDGSVWMSAPWPTDASEPQLFLTDDYILVSDEVGGRPTRDILVAPTP